jgi:hypothetical protein
MTRSFSRDEGGLLPGEAPAWYRRFAAYVALGPSRTIAAVWRQEAPGGRKRQELPGNWRRTARVYRWEERAAAYDLAHAQKSLESLEEVILVHRLIDLKQILALREEITKVLTVATEENKLLSPSALAQLARTLHLLHKLTYRVLEGLPLRKKTEPPSIPVVINMPGIFQRQR